MSLEAAVVATCIGNLLSALVLLLGYMLFELWRDYVTIIFSSFLLSQALSRVTHKAVSTVKALRQPSSPPLLRQLSGFVANEAMHGRLSSVPPLMLLSGILLLLLLDDVSSYGVIFVGLVGTVSLAAALLWLLDKRLLAYQRFVSDESLVAMAALLVLVLTVAFVVTVILVRSVLDVVGLFVLMPEAISALVASEDRATASALVGLVSYVRDLAAAGVEQLRAADPRWGPVAAHVFEQVGNGSNGTAVVESTFVQMRQSFPPPHPAWLATAEDLSKLVLWVSGQEGGDPISFPEAKRIAMAQANSLLEDGEVFELLKSSSGVAKVAGAAGSQGLLLVLSLLLQAPSAPSAWPPTLTLTFDPTPNLGPHPHP